jgi:hypothetical protein
MSGINSLDLKEFITNAVSNVFDTMLSMEVESATDGQPENYKEFKIEPKGWDRSERFGFSSNQHAARVEVFIKTGN